MAWRGGRAGIRGQGGDRAGVRFYFDNHSFWTDWKAEKGKSLILLRCNISIIYIICKSMGNIASWGVCQLGGWGAGGGVIRANGGSGAGGAGGSGAGGAGAEPLPGASRRALA